jgi:hypothetical protein
MRIEKNNVHVDKKNNIGSHVKLFDFDFYLSLIATHSINKIEKKTNKTCLMVVSPNFFVEFYESKMCVVIG